MQGVQQTLKRRVSRHFSACLFRARLFRVVSLERRHFRACVFQSMPLQCDHKYFLNRFDLKFYINNYFTNCGSLFTTLINFKFQTMLTYSTVDTTDSQLITMQTPPTHVFKRLIESMVKPYLVTSVKPYQVKSALNIFRYTK